jgi:hypothetical protein
MFQLIILFLNKIKNRFRFYLFDLLKLSRASQKEMGGKRSSICQRTIAGVKWQDIKRKGRASWFLARCRRTTTQRQKSNVPKASTGNHKLPDSESSSLVSEATTQLDEFFDDEFEAYKHDVVIDGIEEYDTFEEPIDFNSSIQKSFSSKCEEMRSEGMPKRTRCAGSLVSLDCEMVGGGPHKRKNLLARCAVLDEAGQLPKSSTHPCVPPLTFAAAGNVILDEYVTPDEAVTDYRTKWSGIRPRDLIGAPSFREVRQRVAAAVRGRILVGHAIDNDLRVLRLPHPPALIRDTSLYPGLRRELAAVVPSVRIAADSARRL